MKRNNIQTAFDNTLIESDLTDLGVDFSELAIDSILQDGLLKDIPIVNTIVNLIKLSANIQDRLFLKKILYFLNQLKFIPAEKRKAFIDSIDDSKEFRIKVGEKLLYIIDSCEDYEISELIGVLFRAFLESKVNYKDFLKASSVIKQLNISDFKWFIKERKSHYFDLDDVADLISSGLFVLHYEDPDIEVSEQNDHKYLRENPFASKYKTKVDGGGMSVDLSRAGEVILEVFCLSYKKPRIVKI